MYGCYGCGKSGHQMKDFLMPMTNEVEGYQATHSGSYTNSLKAKLFYALQISGEQENSAEVITGMLKVFRIDLYAFVRPSDNFYFVIPYMTMIFDTLQDVLLEPFCVSTTVYDIIVTKRVYRKMPCVLIL